MTKRLPTEFALNMNMSKAVLMQQQDFDALEESNYFDEDNPCHIYFIGRRPRVTIEPNKFEVDRENNTLTLFFNIQRKNEFFPYSLVFLCTEIINAYTIEIKSEYPCATFSIVINGEEILYDEASLFLQRYIHEDFLDIEILYVGQSYGVEGARTAPDRLKSHSTLQAIYAESIRNNPDSNIWLILASFELVMLTIINSREKLWEKEQVKEDKERSAKIMEKFYTNKLNEQQKINFTEAALIRYFEPKYNKEYKKSFPNPAHSTYSQCYELDINAINVELNTINLLNHYFYSDFIDRKPTHNAMFNLNSIEERKSMFDFSVR